MDKFLDDNCIISTPSTWHKSSLRGGDDLIQQRSYAIDNNLGDNFVDSVAEANWTIIPKSFRTLDFGNEGYESFIEIPRNSFL